MIGVLTWAYGTYNMETIGLCDACCVRECDGEAARVRSRRPPPPQLGGVSRMHTKDAYECKTQAPTVQIYLYIIGAHDKRNAK